MKDPKDKKIPTWAVSGHRKPVTRREFLAHGIIPFAAYLTLPSWAQLLTPKNAMAMPNCPTPVGGMIPYITVNLSGGAGLMSNYVPTDQGGQFLPSYDFMGLGKGSDLPIRREFGNVPFAGRLVTQNGIVTEDFYISQFLKGLVSAAPTAKDKTAFVAVCSRADDDAGTNKYSLDGLLTKAGLVGSQLPMMANHDSFTGIHGRPVVTPPPRPFLTYSLEGVLGAVALSSGFNHLSDTKKNKMTKLITDLSVGQSRKLASRDPQSNLADLINCAGIKNEENILMKKGSAVDIRKDPAFGTLSSIWAINNDTPFHAAEMVYSSIAYNVLKGNAGSGAIVIGGYDYHDNTRTLGDKMDFQAGVQVGRLLQTAETLGKPFFIVVNTDGAVVSTQSNSYDSPWASDRGIASGQYILYYNPKGREKTDGHQIGHFINEQCVDASTPTGTSAEGGACAVLANYLSLNNQLGLFEKLVPASVFDPANLKKVLKFGA